jgi:glycosyltransferase involved in cell wall biosynthesis
MQTLSIIIPLYNEAATIIKVLDKVNLVELINGIQKEIIIVNDASTDNSISLVENYIRSNPDLKLSLINLEKNSGKGGAIHSGISKASGDYIIIQDADLEYDPADYNRLLQPIADGMADVVYGSRFVGGHPHRILFFWHSIGNKMLTFVSNMFTNLNLTDMEIGYKLFRSDILKSLQLEEKRFGFEPEVTAKIARIPSIRIYEVGISYYGRTYEEGKKISWKDGVRGIYAILKYNAFISRKQLPVKGANKLGYLTALVFFLAGIILMFTAKGTGDEGDSIMHYLYARYAYQNHDFFFYHWAKPVYVFFAAPFAQSGWHGIQLFNILASTGSILLTFGMAKKLAIPNPWLAALCTAFAPLMMIVSFSGLTEPLFALWMMIGFTWLIDKKIFTGFLWLSFLPFVRSEGLIIISVLVIYAIFKKAWKYIPVLAVGHVFYSVAGYFIYKDFLWVFNRMTYATLSSAYGEGYWNDFIKKLPDVTGVILCFFLVLGMTYGLVRFAGRFIFRERHCISDEELFLVFGCFGVYFAGHSLFWALGIFNSFGLIRVMMAVLPLIGLICARGINFVTTPLDTAFKSRFLLWLSVTLIIVYPFIAFKYGYSWKRDFSLKADQAAENRLADFVKENFPGYKKNIFYYEACHLSVALDNNYFDSTQHKRLFGAFEENNFPDGSFIVWDDWFARMEGRVELHQLEKDPRFQWLGTFTEKDFWGVKRVVKLFRVK